MSTTTAPVVQAKPVVGASFRDLKKGDVLSETQFYTVGDKFTQKDERGKTINLVSLINDTGEAINVDEAYIESCVNSASQFLETRKLSRTEVIQIFLTHPYTAMTVNFNKQVKQADVLKEILDAHTNTAPKDVEKAFKATIKKALEGEERTMVGRHSASTDEFGRIHFTDMLADTTKSSATYDARHRLVDPRTINWLIVKGVKYEVK
jgi:hypothetical protein